MPWKIPTWKGLTGLLLTLSGIVTALTVSPGTLPRPIEQWVIAAGVVLIGIERIADALDNKVAVVAATAAAAGVAPVVAPDASIPPGFGTAPASAPVAS